MRKLTIKQCLSLLLTLCMLLSNCTVGFADGESTAATVTTDENGIVTVTVEEPIESTADVGLLVSENHTYYSDRTETYNTVYVGNLEGEIENIYEGKIDDTATEIDVQSAVTVDGDGTHEETWYEWDEETQSSIPTSVEVENNATGIRVDSGSGDITIIVDGGINVTSEEGYGRGINAAVFEDREEADVSLNISIGDSINVEADTSATGIISKTNTFSEETEAEQIISIDVDGNISASSNGSTTGIISSTNGENAETSITIAGDVTANATGTHEEMQYGWDEEGQWGPAGTKDVGNDAQGISASTSSGNNSIIVEGAVNANSEKGRGRGVSVDINQYNENPEDASIEISIGGNVTVQGGNEAYGIHSSNGYYSYSSEETSDRLVSISVEGDISANSNGETIGISSHSYNINTETDIEVMGNVMADGEGNTRGVDLTTNGTDAETAVTIGGNITASANGTTDIMQYAWDEEFQRMILVVAETVGSEAKGVSASAYSGNSSITVTGEVNATSKEGSSIGVEAGVYQYEEGTETDAFVEVGIGGNVVVQGETQALGVSAENGYASSNVEKTADRIVSIDIDGKIDVISNEVAIGIISSSSSSNAETTITVNGDITATGDGDNIGITTNANADGINTDITVNGNIVIENGNASGINISNYGENTETNITVYGDINASTSGSFEGDISYWDEETQTMIPSTATFNHGALGIQGFVEGDSSIIVDGSINVSSEDGEGTGIAIYTPYRVEDPHDSSVDIEINGDVNVTGKEGAYGISANSFMISDGSVETPEAPSSFERDLSITVDGDVTVKAEERAYAIDINSRDNQQVNVNIEGDVTAEGKGAFGASVGIENADVTLNVGGNIISNCDGIIIYNWSNDSITENDRVQISVGGDVIADENGLYVAGQGTADVNVLIQGTLTGEKEAVVIGSPEVAENVTLTVWKIEPNAEGEFIRVGEDVAAQEIEETEAEDSKQEEQQPEQKANAAEAFAKTINYIIRLQESEGADLSVDGATVTEDGLYTAHEDDTVTLKVTLKPGYELVDAFNNDMKIERAADGNYYVTVPRGGGVLLSVKAGQVDYSRWDDYESPIQVAVVQETKKQSSRAAASKQTDDILASAVQISAQANEDGSTEWTLEMEVPADGFSDGLEVTAELPTLDGVAAELVSTPDVSGLYEDEHCRMEAQDNTLKFSFYKQYTDEEHNEPSLSAGARKVKLSILTKPAESWPENAPCEMKLHGEAGHRGAKYQFDADMTAQEGAASAKWQKVKE